MNGLKACVHRSMTETTKAAATAATFGQVIRRADNALYEAKATGRGRLVMAAGGA